MTLQLSAERLDLEDEVQLSYFVKRKGGKPPRVAFGRLLEISESGLCMEISPLDSDLFMVSRNQLFAMNKFVEMQFFCRSHPKNISIQGRVEWFKRQNKTGQSLDGGGVCTGVIFSYTSSTQRREMAALVGHLRNDRSGCRKCKTAVSSNAVFCYNCGARLPRRRTFLRRAIDSLLSASQ